MGRFVSEDPLAPEFVRNAFVYAAGSPTRLTDPDGLKECDLTIYGGHNLEVVDMIQKEFGDKNKKLTIPDTTFIAGIGCSLQRAGGNNSIKDDGIQDQIKADAPLQRDSWSPRVGQVLVVHRCGQRHARGRPSGAATCQVVVQG